MIYRLRKKFIVISAAAVGIVFALIFGIIFISTKTQLDRTMDMLTDVISENDGTFPAFQQTAPSPSPLPSWNQNERVFNPETSFSTRFFTVYADQDNRILRENTEKVSSIDTATARKYAKKALAVGSKRGWISGFRYKISETEDGKTIVFVNGKTSQSMINGLLYTVLLVLAGSFLIILLLIVFFSKRAVKPSAEAYEKQKQFVTDANHELKTPLTLILSNVDIVESETGKNEWLDDIRTEGERMASLINQLVTLSRMDEESTDIAATDFDLSAVTLDTVSEFEGLAAKKHTKLTADIASDLSCHGDEGTIRQLIAILLDNAVKYCDPDGQIFVTAHAKGHRTVITVENTCHNVGELPLTKLFDPFYRADQARNYTGSFGVGLSIAKGIVQKHKGEIIAYRKQMT